MKSPDSTDERRHDVRYTAVDRRPLEVAVEYDKDDSTRTTDGSLHDISCTMVKLRLPLPLPPDSNFRLKLTAPRLKLDLERRARVYRIQPRGDEQWWVVAYLAEELDEETLDTLAEGGYLDRRRDSRCSIAVEASAKGESAAEEFDVQIRDVSRGGLRLVAATPLEDRQRLMLKVETDGRTEHIPVVVCWQQEVEDGRLTGCSFLNPQDYARLDGFSPAEVHVAPSCRRRTALTYLTAAALIVWALLFLVDWSRLFELAGWVVSQRTP